MNYCIDENNKRKESDDTIVKNDPISRARKRDINV